LAIIGPFMNLIDGLTVMIIAMASLAIVIWRSARRLYSMVREASIALVEQMDSLNENAPGSSPSSDASDGLGGIGPLTQVPIPEGSAAIGRSLSDLNLHAMTGAMVMAIARDGHSVILPCGPEVLGVGDTIVIAGPSGAIAAARDLLTTRAHAEPAQQPNIQ